MAVASRKKKKKKGVYKDIPEKQVVVEWVLLVLSVFLIIVIRIRATTASEQDKTIMDGMVLGLAGIVSANVLSRLYNAAIPKFLSALKTDPLKTRVVGGVILLVSFLLYISR